ncbi:hypothetical protein BGZ98_010254 [Dissophora globulifera]|nr:hypothetical protein BGZ98_010254 [Dissophora globulifera]
MTPVWRTDAPELFRILNIDKRISEGLYSSNMTFPFPEAGAVSFTERHERQRIERGVVNSWAIRGSATGQIIGIFALGPFDHGEDIEPCRSEAGEKMLRCGDLGYWISPEHEGKGIMTRVVVFALTKMARQEFGYDRVHSEAWVENAGSRRVMERAGMRPTVGVPCFVPKFNATKEIAHYIIDV